MKKFRVSFYEAGEHTHNLMYATEQEAVESAQVWIEADTCSAVIYKRLICGRYHWRPISKLLENRQ